MSDEAAGLPISASRSAGGFVFVSGQASVDSAGRILAGTFEQEMRRAFENVSAVLKAQGLSLDDVVRLTSYVRDPDNRTIYNEVYCELFSPPYPARTTLTNCLPEELHFEVDVVAWKGLT